MNRIILIGNGFDLAHNIKTSYTDFINDYWEKVMQNLRNEVNSNVTTYLNIFETEEIKIEDVPGNHYQAGDWVIGNSYDDLVRILEKQRLKLIFKNRFLEILTKKLKERNWVDIENEFYDLLKQAFKNKNCDYKIAELNKDLNQIKNLLGSYLTKIEEKFKTDFGNQQKDERLKHNIGYKIYSPFKLRDFNEASINKKAEFEYQRIHKDIKALKDKAIDLSDLNEENQRLILRIGIDAPLQNIRKLLLSDTAVNYFELMPDEILFLTFNYTFTERLYSNQNEFDFFDSKKTIAKQQIHIHGTTDKYDGNDIIFGFGDEIDEDYKSIENLNDNRYLENIKSIKYLETDNYKRLLEFLNNGEYQIFIFGHSCGISDRTLLNTLFEHKNCSSIKPFYYRKDNGSDNYSDIVRNISRNFNSKTNMRDRVVNKKYCEPLS